MMYKRMITHDNDDDNADTHTDTDTDDIFISVYLWHLFESWPTLGLGSSFARLRREDNHWADTMNVQTEVILGYTVVVAFCFFLDLADMFI